MIRKKSKENATNKQGGLIFQGYPNPGQININDDFINKQGKQ